MGDHRAIASALYSVVVLDELNPVLELGLLDVEDIVRTLANRPEGMEIIVTGRAAPAAIQSAGLHSEMRAHRRPGLDDEHCSVDAEQRDRDLHRRRQANPQAHSARRCRRSAKQPARTKATVF